MIEDASPVWFTYDLWRAGSLSNIGLYNRTISIYEGRHIIRKYAEYWCDASKLFFRPKKDCIALMFFTNEYWWTHLTKEEFILCFPTVKLQN